MTGKRALWAALFGTGILLLVLGILDGGAEDVFAKAVRICSECIGLG